MNFSSALFFILVDAHNGAEEKVVLPCSTDSETGLGILGTVVLRTV